MKKIRVFVEGGSEFGPDVKDYVSDQLRSWKDAASILNTNGWEHLGKDRWRLPGEDDRLPLIAEIVEENGGPLPVSKLPSKRRE